jgi:hypothetical protein
MAGYTRQDLVEKVQKHVGQTTKKLDFDSWLDLVISDIIEECPHAWWRRKRYTFNTVASDGLIDLSASGAAPDFHEAISLVRIDGTTTKPLAFKYLAEDVQAIMATVAETGEPTLYCMEPGESKKFRLCKTPSTVLPMSLLYWANIEISTAPGGGPIPLIPQQFHLVALLGLLKVTLEYLLKASDSRVLSATKNYERQLFKLKNYEHPHVQAQQQELRVKSARETVRSTG